MRLAETRQSADDFNFHCLVPLSTTLDTFVCDRRSRYQNQKYLVLYQKYFEFYQKYLELLSHHCRECNRGLVAGGGVKCVGVLERAARAGCISLSLHRSHPLLGICSAHSSLSRPVTWCSLCSVGGATGCGETSYRDNCRERLAWL